MDSECNKINSLIKNKRSFEKYGFIYHKGLLNGYPVISVRSMIGTVNNVMATTFFAKAYSPLLVINQGTSGAHDKDLSPGDIVLAESVFDMNTRFTKKRKKGEGTLYSDHEYVGAEYSESGIRARKPYFYCDKSIIEIAKQVPNIYGKVVSGRVASGDVWNKEVDKIEFFNKNYSTTCEDMEAFSIAKVCRAMNVPFIGIKIISNSEINDLEYDESYAEMCQNFTVDFIKTYVKTKELI